MFKQQADISQYQKTPPPPPCLSTITYTSSLVVTSIISIWGGYLVFNMVFQVHLMRDHITVTYSNAAYHCVDNAFIF